MSQDVRGRHRAARNALTAALVLTLGLATREASAADACSSQYENAQALSIAGKLLAARTTYLQCGQPGCPEFLRADCTKQYEALARRIPSVILSARSSDGADLVGVQFDVDGNRLSQTVGRAVELDPGPHHVVAIHGAARESFDIVAREGETLRSIVHTFQGEAAAPRPPPRSDPHGAGPSPAVYGLGALGALGFASFAFFGIRAAQDSDQLHEQCAPRCSSDAESKLRTQLILADVSLAVGVVASAAFVWLFLDGRRAPASTAVRF